MNQTIARWNTATAQQLARISAVTAEIVAEHYTSLGRFIPKRATRRVPYAVSVAYVGKGRHHVTRQSAPRAWAVSRLRDLADRMFGSFRMAD